jgi:hypothetical protein
VTLPALLIRLRTLLGPVAPPPQSPDRAIWPDLPVHNFVSGRSASIDDAQRGDAAFSMDGKGKGPLPIAIPQYVSWRDADGVDHAMILIQAEQAPDGTSIVGLRSFHGEETVATLPEITLLGTKKR